MTKPEQRKRDEILGKQIREFLQKRNYANVDTFGVRFPTPTVEDHGATTLYEIRLSRKDNDAVLIEPRITVY